jgi:type I restriction enzyme M protein
MPPTLLGNLPVTDDFLRLVRIRSSLNRARFMHAFPEGQKDYSMTKPIRFEHLQGCIDWWGGKERKGRLENEVAWRVTAEEVKARAYNLDIKNPHTVVDDHGDPGELLASLNAAEAETAKLRDQLKAILAEALAR